MMSNYQNLGMYPVIKVEREYHAPPARRLPKARRTDGPSFFARLLPWGATNRPGRTHTRPGRMTHLPHSTV